MGRRIPRGAGWRLTAVMTLLIALAGVFPSGARAASAIAIAVTDDAGAPLAGAAFGVYAASVDLDGVLYIDAAAALIGGPVVSDEDGVASIGDLPDGLTVGVHQLVIPDGYLSDVAGDQFVTTDPTTPPSLAVVNAVASVADETGSGTGTVTVAVTEASGTAALDGVSIDIHVIDPATGASGDVVASAVSDGDGLAQVDLLAGSYVVTVVPPAGYLPADAQPVAVETTTGDGTAGASVAFGLQPDPTEPTVAPTDAPTAGPTEPPPSDVSEPTATTEPTATVPADAPSASPSATETATAAPYPPATILVRAIVCTSDDEDLIGTLAINPNDDLVSAGATLPDICRPAQEGEFTFSFRDPVLPSPWDNVSLGTRLTDANGFAALETAITRDGQRVFVVELAHQDDFSDPFQLVPNGTLSLLAVRVVGEPRGDVVVRPVDSVTGGALAGTCYDLAAAGLPGVPLASACDADDGADGLITFPAVANGDYVVVPTAVVPGYVFAPTTPLTVDSRPVDLSLSVVPYGTLQLLARSCLSPPAGLTMPTPTPASGDGIQDLDDLTSDALPDSGTATPLVVFSVVDGSAVDAAGTGLELDPTATDCTAIGATLTVTAPDGTTTSVTVGQDGVATPLSLPPTTADARYTVRDDASAAEQAISVEPAGTTTVTMVALPNGMGGDADDADADAIGGTVTAASASSASSAGAISGSMSVSRLAGQVSFTGQTLDAIAGADAIGRLTSGTGAGRVAGVPGDGPTVRALPRTGAGALVSEARGHQASILLGLTALLAVVALATARRTRSRSARFVRDV